MKHHEVIAFMHGPAFAGLATELIETHISWVILAGNRAYKIKKPVTYSFLDFSTLPLRRRYCFEEVRLNRRLAGDMYLGVEELRRRGEEIVISHDLQLPLVDYLVKMRRRQSVSRLDRLVSSGDVDPHHLDDLALVLANFHKGELPVYGVDPLRLRSEWEGLQNDAPLLSEKVGTVDINAIIRSGSEFLAGQEEAITARLHAGMIRDLHGDLHCENIFLDPDPVIFDCIEFNDSFRQIDILNEIAFLCMDLEARGHPELARHFLGRYLYLNPVMQGPADRLLFLFYKMYRAGIRAKVHAIRYEHDHSATRPAHLIRIRTYLKLMDEYARRLHTRRHIDAGHLLV